MLIYIDADACPVKEEVYRVAGRYQLGVFVVSNSAIWVPTRAGIERVVVKGGLDVADDWIAERIEAGDIAITADIPLADRCLRNGASVLGPEGARLHRGFDRRGPRDPGTARHAPPVGRSSAAARRRSSTKDRSRFLSKLDDMIQAIRRRRSP